MQPLCRRILLMAPLTPSFWNSKRAFQMSVSMMRVRSIQQPARALIGQELLKDVEERLVVDELGGVVLVELREVVQHFRLHVLDQLRVVPQLIEPGLQVAAVAVAVHFQVQFDVVPVLAKTQAAHGEVGTADHRVLHLAMRDVIHLAVQKARLLH